MRLRLRLRLRLRSRAVGVVPMVLLPGGGRRTAWLCVEKERRACDAVRVRAEQPEQGGGKDSLESQS